MAVDNEAQRAWIMKVLDIDTAAAGAASGASMAAIDAAGRLATAASQLAGLKAEGDPALPALLAAEAAAAKAVEAGAAEALALLDRLEAELAHALSAARGRDASRGAAGAVEYGKLLLRWHSAQSRVQENLVALGKALLADPEITGDPDFDEIKEAIDDLPDLVPALGGRLDDLLDEARDAGADRPALHREALKVLAQYRKRLGGVSALQELEGFSAETTAGSMRLFGEFSAAFSDLEAELSKAV